MKKLLTLLTAIGLTTTTTTTVVACGKDVLNLATLDLNLQLTIHQEGSEEAIFEAFLSQNQDILGNDLNLDQVDLSNFIPPQTDQEGQLTIKVKSNNSKYKGQVTLIINQGAAQKDLSALGLETTIVAPLESSQNEVFEAFLSQNQAILDNDLNFDQVDLSDFQPAQYIQNGSLTIIAKPRITNEWTGSIQLKTKYILTDANFEEVFKYASDNNLFQFEVPVGTVETLLDLVFKFAQDQLTSNMHQFYELDSNIESIKFGSFWFVNPDDGSRPDLDELNSNVGYTFHSDHFRILIYLNRFDGTEVELDIKDIKITWTVVEKTD